MKRRNNPPAELRAAQKLVGWAARLVRQVEGRPESRENQLHQALADCATVMAAICREQPAFDALPETVIDNLLASLKKAQALLGVGGEGTGTGIPQRRAEQLTGAIVVPKK